MGLVDDQKKIVLKIIHQGIGRLARGKPCKMPGIILDSGTEAGFFHHFHVKVGPLGDTLRLDQFVFALEIFHLFLHLFKNSIGGSSDLLLGNYVMGGGENSRMAFLALDLPGQHVDIRNALDLIAEELHPDGPVCGISGKDLQNVAFYPEGTPVKIHLVPGILDVDELPDHFVPVLFHAGAQGDHHVKKFLGSAQTVDTGYRRHDDHIPALAERRRSGEPQLIDLVVGGSVFGDIGVRGRHIGFRLVIIIIGDKIFHRVVGKEFLEFSVQLRRQGLIVGKHQRRLI